MLKCFWPIIDNQSLVNLELWVASSTCRMRLGAKINPSGWLLSFKKQRPSFRQAADAKRRWQTLFSLDIFMSYDN